MYLLHTRLSVIFCDKINSQAVLLEIALQFQVRKERVFGIRCRKMMQKICRRDEKLMPEKCRLECGL